MVAPGAGMVSQSINQVTAGDWDALEELLAGLGIEHDDIAELRQASEADAEELPEEDPRSSSGFEPRQRR